MKIGYSADVERRRIQLESTYQRPLVLLATFKGGREKEKEIHARFSHLRLGRTEQFCPAPELLEFLGRPLLVGANPHAVEVMETATRSLASLRGTEAYAKWFYDLCDFAHLPAASLVEQALREWAKSHGFTEPQPPR